MSNVDGYAIYMHIGRINCPELNQHYRQHTLGSKIMWHL